MNKLNSTLVAIVSLLIVGGMSAGAALAQIQSTTTNERPSANPINQDVSNFTEYKQVMIFFYSKVFLQRNKTQITVPFSFKEKQPQPIFAGFNTKTNPHEVLLYHPQLEHLDWPTITDGSQVLYQRKPTFTTIKDFLAHLPNKNKLATDPLMVVAHPEFRGGPSTNSLLNLDSLDYILTTYQPIKKIGDAYYGQRVLDATDAAITADGRIEWFVHIPNNVASNPIYMGNIDINYLQ